MSDTLYRTAGDTGPPATFDLQIDAAGYSLTGQTVTCYLRTQAGVLAQTITTVTLADQVATPGRCTTVFTGAQLVEGAYTLEWYLPTADLTFPAARKDRPLLVVRSAAA